MTYRNLNISSRSLECKERGSKFDIMLLFMSAMKNQTLTSHVTSRYVFVIDFNKLCGRFNNL